MQTLAQKYPDAHRNLQQRGYVHIAALMERFGKCVELDNALGLNSASNLWCHGRTTPSFKSEDLAKDYIAGISPIVNGVDVSAPDVKEEQPVEDGAPVFMVVCPAGREGKVSKVLQMLNCEVVEV